MAHVSVVIDGKTFRMACEDGQEEHLRTLAAKLDEAMQALKNGFGEIGDQRLAIMAGIMIADELAEANRQKRGLEAEISSLKENRSALVERYQVAEDTLARAITETARRVEGIADKLKSAGQRQPLHEEKPAAE
ncbi:MAG: cell division protein ZapA [Pseudomonadota bacterium]